jgi:tRNA(fMet)-specific endonuclease VapC
VVLAELFYGAHRGAVSKQVANLALIARLQQRFASLPFDDRAAAEYGKIRAYLAGQGTPIGPNDLMIASIALANGLTFVTHNTGEFKVGPVSNPSGRATYGRVGNPSHVEFNRVPGLKLEDWQ